MESIISHVKGARFCASGMCNQIPRTSLGDSPNPCPPSLQERWERHKNFERIRFDMQVCRHVSKNNTKNMFQKLLKLWIGFIFLGYMVLDILDGFGNKVLVQDISVNEKFIGSCK